MGHKALDKRRSDDQMERFTGWVFRILFHSGYFWGIATALSQINFFIKFTKTNMLYQITVI